LFIVPGKTGGCYLSGCGFARGIDTNASPCPLQRRGFKKSEAKVLSFGEDLGEAKRLVFICSLYPGKQAAAIYPVVALHEE